LALGIYLRDGGAWNDFKLEDAGRVLVRGVKDKGDIKTTDALNEAFELGQQI
jgi:hypothetical protein